VDADGGRGADSGAAAADAAAPADALPGPEEDAAAPDAAAVAPIEGPPRFRFPIHDEDRRRIQTGPVFGVDHDPEVYSGVDQINCTDHQGRSFPWCYDEHDGSDFVLRGGFPAMDNGSARIVAGSAGEVIDTRDGHYDRCRADAGSVDVDCDGHPMRANLVRIRHANGWESSYLHMRKGSVEVAVGDWVDCGDVLGLVGSSGRSSFPHLHFEVFDPDGESVDPFAGPMSQPESFWVEQIAEDMLPGAACDPRLEGL
jgi:murein DD-endopeptidase MepM/ murein hydrolase activator NlpD